MKLSIVFPVMNQFPLATVAIQSALDNLTADANVEVLIIDNGSDTPFQYQGFGRGIFNVTTKLGARVEVQIIRHEKNIGVYPTFWDGTITGEVVAFFHSDLIICEQDWNKRVMECFEKDRRLGLIGFIGSNEIDGSGGRGLGTTSNFQGGTYLPIDRINYENVKWTGSPAHVHGKVNAGFTAAAVVDGCAMIFSREALRDLKMRADFPIHHFYDRLLSCEVREHGYGMGVLGIACDHISGQTANQEPKYGDTAKEWAEAHGLVMEPWHNWDTVLYKTAESMWLGEYRDVKHLVPCRV